MLIIKKYYNWKLAIVKIGFDNRFMLWQDNDLKYTIKKTKKFFKDLNLII